MNYTEQENAAIETLSHWLEHPNELGQKPCEIQIAGSFELDEMKYYIIKFKKNASDSWMVGVAGGYEDDDDLESCGHTYSDFKEYKEETAKVECLNMVNMIKDYWKAKAAEFLKNQGNQ